MHDELSPLFANGIIDSETHLKICCVYTIMSEMNKKGSVDYQNGVIYIMKNNTNDKVYVGSTTGAISKRFNKHVSHIGKATDTTWRFYAAMAEIGPGNFMWEELEKYPCQNKSQLTSREGYWIKHYKSWKAEQGYSKS